MARIIYLAFPSGAVQGGQKMLFRHVETLRALGFDAVCLLGAKSQPPTWFEHAAPVVQGEFPIEADDILAVPDDAPQMLAQVAPIRARTVVISQNPYLFTALSLQAMARFPADRLPPFIVMAPGQAALLGRLYPQAQVERVPCFADERLFAPGAKTPAVAYAPRKRPVEAASIQGLFGALHPRHASLDWRGLEEATETEVVATLGAASLFLSLSRLESVGLTTLESMASGCVCAGFNGVGGWEYATPENGFWAPDEDCEAAADALAQAADLVETGGAPLKAMVEAGRETAARWSYAAFREALEATWMKLAPEARLRNGPLD
ncbi:MAG: glycosyltransferase family 1 protein [Phenylobacterium sp.]|nr:MAG: glycosyltransferase family 1 protein [Phenylobacterium sp.]